MSHNQRKFFVLDTNVILHDSSCVYQFKDNDIIIPISVIEELDQFKRGSGILNYHAREFLRAIDSMSGNQLFNGGVPIGKEKGRLAIHLQQPFHEEVARNFDAKKADHQILNTAYRLKEENPGKEVTLVTKDVNLRMKAKALGLKSEDYTTDHIRDIRELYSGYRTEDNIPPSIIDRLHQTPFEIAVEDLPLSVPLRSNEFAILRSDRKSVLITMDPVRDRIRKVDKATAYGINPRNAEQSFAIDALLNDDIPLVTITGKAGTGKTLLALAAALERRENYRQIFIARPNVPLSNRDLGYLPGDVKSKLDPYMQPLYDNLTVIQNQFSCHDKKKQRVKELIEDEKIVVSPLPYIRGRSLVKIYFIIDEAQNLTPHEVKTILTRAGENTKIVFTGDIFQIDHPYLDTQSNGLSYLVEKMEGQDKHAHIDLVRGERSALSELAIQLL
ncbi:PhoH family protein [Desulfobotulus sp. H1]|uniref:PhoH family protein n=1 Tax=Desulfobotulus pelophilus TaxID=2823377 RepID=A0ABT3ND43_9BACT|nr:PhoH family protein [Desulfobotulus pelophilus]MCW7755384.1 PhoH family protein [Desulfobotulus pelophilus]